MCGLFYKDRVRGVEDIRVEVIGVWKVYRGCRSSERGKSCVDCKGCGDVEII